MSYPVPEGSRETIVELLTKLMVVPLQSLNVFHWRYYVFQSDHFGIHTLQKLVNGSNTSARTTPYAISQDGCDEFTSKLLSNANDIVLGSRRDFIYYLPQNSV